jgi:hypothetical protein
MKNFTVMIRRTSLIAMDFDDDHSYDAKAYENTK